LFDKNPKPTKSILKIFTSIKFFKNEAKNIGCTRERKLLGIQAK
jgi:hypothetical protein